jgi:hypothetical protein
VEEDRVVLEGRWQPVAANSSSPSLSAVRVVCLQRPRTCTEELSVLAEDPAVQRQPASYQIKDWTTWQLRAVRRDEGKDVELRISIRGLAAEKVLVDRSSKGGSATRWRLE